MTGAVSRLTAALADRYTIERELGAGGMATVYLAHDVRHDRKVAIKILRPELAAVIGAERFLSEIKTTANLQHPHILPLFDSGSADGQLFYVMPYVEGETLRGRLERETQLPVGDAVRLATAVAGALEYAHRHGVVHRDIKPENILLQDDSALVADFGISLAVQQAGGERMTQTGMSLGTPQYMSPEQAMGAREIGPRSDIYALGAITYEMLSGEPPFTGPSAQAIVAKVMTESPKALTAQRKSVPPNVSAAVGRALEKLPADRFASARDFAQALADAGFRHDAGVTAGVGPTWVGHGVGNRRWLAAGLALVVAALGGAWIGATLTGSSVEAAPPGALRFEMALPGDSGAAALPGDVISLRLSSDGRTVVAVGAGPGGVPQLFAREVSELEWRSIPGTAGAAAPFFSHDGQWIAFVVDGQLSKVPLAGGARVGLARVGELSGVGSWGPHDRILIAIGGQLATIPGAGGIPKFVSSATQGSRQVGQFHPVALDDGVHAFFSQNRGSADPEIFLISLESGDTARLGVRGRPIGVIDDFLVYFGTSNDLAAVRFDVSARRTVGDPIRLAAAVSTLGERNRSTAAVSRSGSLVYLGGEVRFEVVLRQLDGRDRLLWSSPIVTRSPRFSPDAQRIVVEIDRDIWLLSRSPDVAPRRLTSDTANMRPEWTSDGRIVYRSLRGGRGTLRARPVDDGGADESLLELSDREIWQGMLSPDGKSIAFRTGSLSGADIWSRAVAGDTALRPIAVTSFEEHSPRISPDGRWVAHVSSEEGSSEVYVRPYPSGSAAVRISLDGGEEPVWSRDGASLYYHRGRQLIRASLRTTPSIAVLSRTVLMDDFLSGDSGHPGYDVAPNGQEFVTTRAAYQNPRLLFVHDWRHELRARFPQAKR